MTKEKVSGLPVMKSTCKTCPFKKCGDRGEWRDVELATKVIGRNLFNSQQICHGTEGENREPRNRCKGYYEYSVEIYKRIGMDENELNKILNDPKYFENGNK